MCTESLGFKYKLTIKYSHVENFVSKKTQVLSYLWTQFNTWMHAIYLPCQYFSRSLIPNMTSMSDWLS